MIVVMELQSTLREKAAVVHLAEQHELSVSVWETSSGYQIGLAGEAPDGFEERLTDCSGVIEVRSDAPGWLLVARDTQPEPTRVRVGRAVFGGNEVVVVAGPCSVESPEQMRTVAEGVANAGAGALRGGAFKPRTSPYAFQGLGREALELLAEAKRQSGLPIVTEIMDVRELDMVAEVADVLQVGARNMQNTPLLQALGGVRRPVLLKRGMSATLEELLFAAEYIVSAGNPQVMLCERGIRTFGRHCRSTLDLAAVAALKAKSHLPVVVDPSHAAGLRSLVEPLALAAVAAGADGLLVEVHPRPDQAKSDAAQQLDLAAFSSMMERIDAVARAIGRQGHGRPAQSDPVATGVSSRPPHSVQLPS